MDQQVQVLADHEPGVDERRHLRTGQRTRDHLVHPAAAEEGDAVAHRGTVGRHRTGDRRDQRDPLIAVAGDDAEAVGSHSKQLGLGHGDPAWSFTRSPRIGLDTTASGARSVRSRAVTLLVVTDPRFLDHDTGAGHPERPKRLRAVDAGIAAAGLGDAITQVRAEPAPRAAVEAVHPAELVDALERFCAAGGGAIDADTRVGPSSFEVAMLAAGSGLELVRRLDAGEGTVGFCAVRPPGHHATATRCMGFCMFNNVAVTAAALADRGERVAIVDYDAHHGNGTQDIFYEDPRVLYVSLHEWPLYPGTGALDDVGAGAGAGTTLNVPLPAGTAGDVYRRALDELVDPGHRALRPHVVAAVGRVRRASGRPADRAGPVLRRLRRPHQAAGRGRPDRADASSSSRAGTTSRACATRSPPRSPRQSVSICGPSRRPVVTRAPIGWPPSSTSTERTPTDRSADQRASHRRSGGPVAQLADLLHHLIDQRGSDLLIKVGSPPHLRVNGRLQATEFPQMGPAEIEEVVAELLPAAKAEELIDTGEVDVAHSVAGLGRFRVNVYRQRGSLGLAVRRVVPGAPAIGDLHLPEVIEKIAAEPHGLIIVTGAAASGRTTTVAGIIDHVNAHRAAHIVTLEDPIEVLHEDKQSLVSQREIGADTGSLLSGIRRAGRQNADVIFVDEIRDVEVAAAVLSEAASGRLVVSTMSTLSAAETVRRLLELFPPDQQVPARRALASLLRG